jgi:aspartokinase-like uncharacterized kinase
MSLDAVLKVGGSLGRSEGLRRLCREIGRLGEKYSLMVVPGGGAFADLVREVYRKYGLGETVAHSMALLAMDQYGFLLHHLIRDSRIETGPESAALKAKPGRVSVLLPSSTVLRDSGLPHTWQVTSDTVAAWVACEAACRRVVLLKDVDGLMRKIKSEAAGADIIDEMSVEELAEHVGGVDEYLARALHGRQVETWIINGLRPERLVELLDAGETAGTRIRPEPIA